MSSSVVYQDLETGKPRISAQKKWLIGGGILVLVALAIVLPIVLVANGKKDKDNKKPEPPPSLQSQVRIENLMLHLENLNAIANEFGGSRAVLFGYNKSAEYVMKELQNKAGKYFEVVQQHFQITLFETVEPPQLIQIAPNYMEFQLNKDFNFMGSLEGPIGINGSLHQAKLLGCTEADYEDASGKIVLIARGECSFRQKVLTATQKGAIGAIIYNYENSLFSGTLDGKVDIPVFAVPKIIGEFLKQIESVEMEMIAHERSFETTTSNIIATSKTGSEENMIVYGSHLDSVPAGPGINDNGSGTACNLELAIQMAKLKIKPKNQVRFIWYGAEEVGLLGSKFYVANLSSEEKNNTALNINLDMIASPNYFIGVYNGSGASEDIRTASAKIQATFEEYLKGRNLESKPTPFDGRSDYKPYIDNGIPAGGLATGAEKIKSAEEREMFGGLANAPFDPCYHQACDTVANINTLVFEELTQAAAFVLEKFAMEDDIRAFLDS